MWAPLTLCACDKPAATPPEAAPEAPLSPDPEPAPARPPLLVDSARTVAALARLASCIEKTKGGVESAVVAHAAIRNPAGDLKQAYAAFRSEVDALGTHRKALSSATGAVRREASALLARWKDAIEALDDADRKKIGQDRLASTGACLDTILKDERKAPEAMRALLALLVDHRLYLEHDLNPEAARSLAFDDKKLAELSANASSVLDRMREATRSCTESLTP